MVKQQPYLLLITRFNFPWKDHDSFSGLLIPKVSRLHLQLIALWDSYCALGKSAFLLGTSIRTSNLAAPKVEGMGKTKFLVDHGHPGRWGHFCFYILVDESLLPFGGMVSYSGLRFNNYTASWKAIPHPWRALPLDYHCRFPFIRLFLCS